MTEAYEYYALAVRLKPNDAMLRRNLGDFCQHEGLLDEARAAYREAVRLTDQELRQNPRSPDLRMYRALYLAKAGDCATAAQALVEVGPGLIWTSADFTYSAAMIHSLCGNRARSIEALRRALELGIPSQKVLKDDEFRALRDDPDFRRLTGGRSRAPGPPLTRGSTGGP
jgi:tetratricopeptide (TPR) repeat protein